MAGGSCRYDFDHMTDKPPVSSSGQFDVSGPNGMPAALRAAATKVQLDAGDRLFVAGGKPAAMYYVVAGELRLIRLSFSGETVVLQRARQGFLAEASLESTAYHCDAVATESSVVLRFPRSLFRSCIDDDPNFRSAWIAHLSRELRRTRAQCERLALKTAAERILHFIDGEGENGAITLTQSRKAWAAELGLSHEALYRTLAGLQKVGTIRVEGRVVSVVRRDRPK